MGEGVRSSHQMNPARHTAKARTQDNTPGDVHPMRLPRVIASRIVSSAPALRVEPNQSKDGRCPPCLSWANRLFSSTIMAAASTIIPTGTFTRNTERHPRALTRIPPSAIPLIDPTPTTLNWEPSAFPRSDPGNTDSTIACPLACTIAELTPWMTRATISIARLPDKPAAAEARTNIVNPVTYTCFRPRMSDTRPIGSSSDDMASVSLMAIHSTVSRLAPKCPAMDGSAIRMLPCPQTGHEHPRGDGGEHPPLVVGQFRQLLPGAFVIQGQPRRQRQAGQQHQKQPAGSYQQPGDSHLGSPDFDSGRRTRYQGRVKVVQENFHRHHLGHPPGRCPPRRHPSPGKPP